MPGRILDRLLPLVPIVVPPAAEQPHEKNIVSTWIFPSIVRKGKKGAFRLEIRDKRDAHEFRVMDRKETASRSKILS